MKKLILIAAAFLIITPIKSQTGNSPVIIDKMEQAGDYNIELHATKDSITVYLLDSTMRELPNKYAKGIAIMHRNSSDSTTLNLQTKGKFGFTAGVSGASNFLSCEIIFTLNDKKVRATINNKPNTKQ